MVAGFVGLGRLAASAASPLCSRKVYETHHWKTFDNLGAHKQSSRYSGDCSFLLLPSSNAKEEG